MRIIDALNKMQTIINIPFEHYLQTLNWIISFVLREKLGKYWN